jgi:hypothetical protein
MGCAGMVYVVMEAADILHAPDPIHGATAETAVKVRRIHV